MKKILFIPWTFSGGGGSEKILEILINKLKNSNEDFDIKIFELEKGIYPKKGIHAESFIKGMHLDTGIKSKIIRKFKFILLTNFPIIVNRRFKKKKYDYVIGFNYLYPTFLISNLKGKKINWFHGTIDNLDYRKLSGINKFVCKFWYKKQEKAILKSDFIVAISDETYNSIINIYPQSIEKVKKIYNGYEFNEIKEKAMEECEDSSDLVFVGRLDQNKNVTELIEIVKLVKVFKPEIKLNIIGEGIERDKILNLIKKYNLEENVKMLGYINNPYKYMKNTKINVLVSIREGFPTVLIEGLYLGKPFISTKIGGVNEISKNGEVGIIAENRDVFVKNIIELLDDKDKYEKMSLKGSLYVQKFSSENFYKEFLTLIE